MKILYKGEICEVEIISVFEKQCECVGKYYAKYKLENGEIINPGECSGLL